MGTLWYIRVTLQADLVPSPREHMGVVCGMNSMALKAHPCLYRGMDLLMVKLPCLVAVKAQLRRHFYEQFLFRASMGIMAGHTLTYLVRPVPSSATEFLLAMTVQTESWGVLLEEFVIGGSMGIMAGGAHPCLNRRMHDLVSHYLCLVMTGKTQIRHRGNEHPGLCIGTMGVMAGKASHLKGRVFKPSAKVILGVTLETQIRWGVN